MSHTNSILFLGDMRNSFEQRLLSGVAGYARLRKPRWSLRWSNNIETLPNEKVDGLVVFALKPEDFQLVKKSGYPVVVTSARHVGTGAPAVVTDDEAIGRVAARFFQNKFYQSFAYFGPQDIPFGPARAKGFVRALQPETVRMIHLPEQLEFAQRLRVLQERIRGLPPATAVFTANDVFARAILETAWNCGCKVPGDLAVLGVDADHLVGLSCPIDLSSIDSRPEEIGRRAAQLLDQMLSLPGSVAADTVIRVLPGEVVEGSSTDSLATDDPLVIRANMIMQQHAPEQDFSLDTLAEKVGCSRRLLEMRYARITDTGMAGQLWQYRLDRARELLRTTNLTLAEIAERSGFRNPYHFSDKFRKIVGVTPGQFRRKGNESH